MTDDKVLVEFSEADISELADQIVDEVVARYPGILDALGESAIKEDR